MSLKSAERSRRRSEVGWWKFCLATSNGVIAHFHLLTLKGEDTRFDSAKLPGFTSSSSSPHLLPAFLVEDIAETLQCRLFSTVHTGLFSGLDLNTLGLFLNRLDVLFIPELKVQPDGIMRAFRLLKCVFLKSHNTPTQSI